MNNNEIIGKVHNSMYQKTGVAIASGAFYKQWGDKKFPHTKQLRFSKSGKEDIEKAYATHYIDTAKVSELKNQ
ncbi:hypothetical protein HZF24_04690 [Sedimentibacter hydroxybenzoicus DSM 7310]|uniref:Uncharacterized protein n=1 Tax=Sedimentibacter hydroxybenzoicus DSM 7310 TaxID=1123245 RepID=A0A974GVI7_SEDHY|nr:hypothetical protein [Sedimentibacter hydroxybenzoicus]NYB73432.1 hypothetical protein [Sedimentibacter hydroxybenzoicus DSM 7310]